MRKVNLLAVCATAFASMLVFASCSQPEPAAEPSLDDEAAVTRATSLDNFARVVYVEVNDVNPLNAGEYTLSNGEPFFTHVILFASNIRGDASGNVHNYNNPNNEAILSNPAKYIQPLRDKGIKVIMGNLGDHTGAGFANLTVDQIDTYTDDLVAYDDIVDGYDFDDEWAEYGTRGYPAANSTSFSNLILALDAKTDGLITIFDYANSSTLNSAAASCVDMAYYSALNGYSTNPRFSIPLSRYCPYFCDLSGFVSPISVRSNVLASANANAGGVCFFNLPANTSRLSAFNAAAQAFGLTCSHSGTIYAKDYGN